MVLQKRCVVLILVIENKDLVCKYLGHLVLYMAEGVRCYEIYI
jgi:hypothetical protein